MFGIENYAGFLLAGVLLNITPGQDTIYIISRSIAQGRKAGVASALGISTGSLFHTIAAALGLSTLLSTSPILFDTVKYCGAAYLIYLGIQMILQVSTLKSFTSEIKEISISKIYRKGILTNILNPKVALFFIAFLPQFIAIDNQYGIVPFLTLGVTFIVTGTIWCLLLAYFSSSISKQLRRKPRIKMVLDSICGIVFIALGIKLFITKR